MPDKEVFPLGRDRRKIRRNAKIIVFGMHCRFDRATCQNATPLRSCSALPPPRGIAPTANVDRMLRSLDPRGRKIEPQGFRVAMNEIEDRMTTCIHTRNKVRPRYRTLRRDAGCKPGEKSPWASSFKRSLASFLRAPEPMQELGIHAVDALENNRGADRYANEPGRTGRKTASPLRLKAAKSTVPRVFSSETQSSKVLVPLCDSSSERC